MNPLRLALVSAFSLVALAPTAVYAEPLVWNVDAVEAQGAGCRFADSAAGPADAFLIANGSDVTAVFTSLGAVFQNDGRTGQLTSSCRYRIPGTLETGLFLSRIDQTVTYGLVKTAGVGVRILGTTNFARRLPNGRSMPSDLMKNLAQAQAVFPVHATLNEPLANLIPQPVRVRRGEQGDNGFTRFCAGGRGRAIDALASLQIALDKKTPDAQVTVSIDGLDVRYMVGVALDTCR